MNFSDFSRVMSGFSFFYAPEGWDVDWDESGRGRAALVSAKEGISLHFWRWLAPVSGSLWADKREVGSSTLPRPIDKMKPRRYIAAGLSSFLARILAEPSGTRAFACAQYRI